MFRALSLTLLIMAAAPALAQTTAPANPTTPISPPTAPTTPPEKIAPADNSLSTRMSDQKGTITPPNVDPGMSVTPPRQNTTTMPVIPPPGSAGGDRSVIPK